MDEDRLLVLEQMLKETSEGAVESEKKYDEVKFSVIFIYETNDGHFFPSNSKLMQSC